jgi:hypothetical protein
MLGPGHGRCSVSRPRLLERRKGNGARHAVIDDDPFTALCGRLLDGSYDTVDWFYPSGDPQPGWKLCGRCNTAAQDVLWGEAL